MHFKKVEIYGFKSFAEKTVIHFEPGVTAIVGPNGCGKSNVSDAIRWVLGEQSAKSLRGASMEDVIFSGSSAREALNLAEVSLTLSNEERVLPIDYDEVTITRRLYRSGDSEYLLNNNVVRLRDIHEMLMGTGIGTESYAIIEQGKMDVILNSKPDDRREIFEEAAGITKFKSKKREALRKLEQTDLNLLRVNDIVQEVKRQIGSIERQARKAEIYKKDFDEMKKLELWVASREFLVFEDRRQGREGELESLRAQEGEYLSQMQTIEEVCRENRYALEMIDETLRAQDLEEREISAEIRRSQDRALLNRERVGELVERKENLSRQIEMTRRRAEEFTREYENLCAEYEVVQTEELEGQAFLAGVEIEFGAIEKNIQESYDAETTVRRRLSEINEEKNRCQNELAKLEAEFEALRLRSGRLKEDQAVARADLDEAEISLASALEETQGQEAELSRSQDTMKTAEAELVTALQKIKDETDSLNDRKLEAQALRTKIDHLEDLKNRHEGYLGGVKALLAEQSSLGGMVGLLADLLTVEKGYEQAAEAALESFLQAVVFRTDEDVLAAAEFLRRAGQGRALLISLELDRGVSTFSSSQADSILKYISPDSSVQGLLEKLIGNVYFVADPREAFSISKSHTGIACVTREGERFEGQVVMGGSLSGEAGPLVGREARLRDLRESATALESRIALADAAVSALETEEVRLREEVKRIGETIVKLQVVLNDLSNRKNNAEERKSKLDGELALLSRELESLFVEESRLIERRNGQAEIEVRLVAEEHSSDQSLLSIQAGIRERFKEKEALLVRLAETRQKQSHCTARREKIDKDKNWVLESKSNEEAQGRLFEKEIEDTVARKEGLENESAGLEVEIERLSARRDEILLRAQVVKGEREESSVRLESAERERSDRQGFLNGVREKTHALEMEAAQIRFEIDKLKERIFNVYQIDLLVQNDIQASLEGAAEALGSAQNAGVDPEEAKLEIQRFREKLAKMGPVNLVAIEEYEEMKQRFDFLNKQQTDLLQAKDDLHKAILKINRTTKELFTETFTKVQKYFTEYYRLLFSGGNAELILLDENDVLESGIEIVARPPGKKLQSISLLSGGEKALTAVALLFALFKVKPSPFCILDEIDAPLDETNVERFCNVLKEFIVGSQFILITHNKRTMSLADAMYGVTMAQTGVSKIVSVRFNDRKIATNGNGAHVVAAIEAAPTA